MIWTSPPIFTSIFPLHSLSCIRTPVCGACPPGTTTAKSAWCPMKQVTIHHKDQLVVYLTYCSVFWGPNLAPIPIANFLIFSNFRPKIPNCNLQKKILYKLSKFSGKTKQNKKNNFKYSRKRSIAL